MKITLLLILLLNACILKADNTEDNILLMKDKLFEVKTLLYKGKVPSQDQVSEISNALMRLKSSDKLLKESFTNFFNLFKTTHESDTLVKILNLFSNQFNLAYCEKFYSEANNSNKIKFLFFTTSLSCECTLEMCQQYDKALHLFLDQNGGETEFVVIDSYYNDSLVTKYDISFVPAVVVLDKNNKETMRYVREENIAVLLSNLYNQGAKDNDN